MTTLVEQTAISEETLTAIPEQKMSVRVTPRRPVASPNGGNRPRRATAPQRIDKTVEERAKVLLVRLADLEVGQPDRAWVRERVIELYLPLAEYLARRFKNRGEPYDDLVQVATIGLIKSVDGYDPRRGVEFASYAIPTIVGELKRHFRDKGWSVRVPRRLQELKIEITKAVSDLTQQLKRSPTVADLAKHLEISEEDVLAGLDTANAYSALSLHTPVAGGESGPEVMDLLGDEDRGMQSVEDRATLRPLLKQLPEREQRIIALRFFGNMTQSQIANEIGISQMHVSRLLARSLRQLREGMLVDA
ncbi:MAG: RNA polymerase sigma factor SigF [Micromonosporaceae bacterium]